MKYYALTLTHKISQIDGFDSEADLDKFGTETSSFTEEEKKLRTAAGDMHGPPVVLVLIAENLEAVTINNFEQPFAVYLKGEKYMCVKQSDISVDERTEPPAETHETDPLQQ